MIDDSRLFTIPVPGTFRLNETRAAKQKLSRQVREMEEELEDIRQKMESMRQENRKAEKVRRDVSLKL